MTRGKSLLISTCLLLFGGLPAWAQENPYTYVKMSLFVPWTLYFIFLACVLIPFVLLILLAWGKHAANEDKQDLER